MQQLKNTKTINIEDLVRENVRKLKPYSSARDEFVGQADVYLDANENPYETGLNRYPDPYQKELKKELSLLKEVPVSQMLLGNGSDEVLDLIFRAFCEPKEDNIIITPPTYGMYKVLAETNDIQIKEAPLNDDFSLNVSSILSKVDNKTKLLFLCSPNNPSGNSLEEEDIAFLLNEFNGLVILDEAYIDFSSRKSWTRALASFPNLIICQTLSKAWGLAGIRLGICYASEYLITILNKIKPPYNINQLSQQKALEVIKDRNAYQKKLSTIISEKEKLKEALDKLNIVEKLFPSDANFWLVKVNDANKLYEFLANKGVITRNRNNQFGCKNCLRITIGTAEENKTLIETLKQYQK